ncbi:hypothetical protein CTEN210_07169 [Chaetoceros tenuissimus]|uniref:Uncharacterized protein n=1 Tax=Chaetoceros tenuissimus TaxID=426638 RepID=A0AAD3CR85_9STRA|nr:hypothetical protein CTEN210_07169 [Chaetoceros tenuissimus]
MSWLGILIETEASSLLDGVHVDGVSCLEETSLNCNEQVRLVRFLINPEENCDIDDINSEEEEDIFHEALEEVPSSSVSISKQFTTFWAEEGLPVLFCKSSLDHTDTPSPLAFSAGLLGSVDLLLELGESFPVIFDTNANLVISPCASDFVPGSIQKLQNHYIGGLANGLPISGIRTVRWVFTIEGDRDVILSIQCYHIPTAKACLLSPQRIFSKQHGFIGKFQLEEESSVLQIEGLPDLEVYYNSESNLPVSMARNFSTSQPQANLGVLNPENKNLTAAQKDFLCWHYPLGHMGTQRLKGLL